MRLRTVTTDDGTHIALRDVGEGPAVLLIHGWGMSSEVWDRQIRVLAASGRRVLAIDQRGHGSSDAPHGDYSIARLAADAACVLLECGISNERRAAVVGWSIGGLVGVRLAHDWPDLADRVVLVASQGVAAAHHPAFPFGLSGDVALSSLVAAEHRDRVRHRRRAVVRQFAEPPAQEVADWLHRVCLQLPSWAGDAAMAALLTTEQLALGDALRVPVSQVVGTRDPALDLQGARWLHQRWGTDLTELECGHYPMLELPNEFDAALRGCLAEESPTRRPVRPTPV